MTQPTQVVVMMNNSRVFMYRDVGGYTEELRRWLEEHGLIHRSLCNEVGKGYKEAAALLEYGPTAYGIRFDNGIYDGAYPSRYDRASLYFNNPEMAVLFKLMWCGGE